MAKPRTLKTITVAELIDLLEDQDPKTLVIFTADYGDHHHTPQALPIRGEFETVKVERNAYSNSGFAIAGDDHDDPSAPEGVDDFLVIR